MSRYYGQIQGSRGEATRMGNASSGMFGHIRGWNIGARVDMDAEGDTDVCRVRVTTGSAGYGNGESLGTFERGEDGSILWRPTLAVVNCLLQAHGRKPLSTDNLGETSTVKLYD